MGDLEHGAEGARAVPLEPCLRRAQFEDCLYRRGDAFDGEAEVAKQSARGRRLAEAIDANHGAGAAHVLAPEVGHPGFDSDVRQLPVANT